MNVMKATGLGEPETVGKKSLFQPPTEKRMTSQEYAERVGKRTPRLRITTDLTKQAMEAIQTLQHQHRIQTGKALPTWKIVSAALELYRKQRKDQDAKAG